MRASTAGWASTSAGMDFRAFEDTNTSRQGQRARRGPESSRAARVILPRVPACLEPGGGSAAGLGGRFQLLLVVAHLLQRLGVDHVGHRAVAVLGVGAHLLLPPVRA